MQTSSHQRGSLDHSPASVRYSFERAGLRVSFAISLFFDHARNVQTLISARTLLDRSSSWTHFLATVDRAEYAAVFGGDQYVAFVARIYRNRTDRAAVRNRWFEPANGKRLRAEQDPREAECDSDAPAEGKHVLWVNERRECPADPDYAFAGFFDWEVPERQPQRRRARARGIERIGGHHEHAFARACIECGVR